MPMIPAQTLPSVAPTGATGVFQRADGATPEAFGAGVAQAGQGLAATLGQAAKMAEDFAERSSVAAAKDADTAQKTELDRMMFDPQEGYLNRLGKDAVDGYPAFYRDANERLNTILNELPSTRAKQLFREVAERNLEQALRSAQSHAGKQQHVHEATAAEARVEAYQNSAQLYANDDRRFSQAVGVIRGEMGELGRIMGWPPERVAVETNKRMSQTIEQRIERVMADSPLAAQQLYQANEAYIEATRKPILEHRLKAAVLPVEARLAVDEIFAAVDPAKMQGVRDARMLLPTLLPQVEARAEKLHPGDPMFREMATNVLKGRVATIAQEQDAVRRENQGTLLDIAVKKSPTSIDALLAQPGARAAWSSLDPQDQLALISLTERNAAGDKVRSNPKVMQEVFERINADENDPQKIRSVTELAKFMGPGMLNHADYTRLVADLERSRTPEGNAFQKSVQNARTTARAMLKSSIVGQSLGPEVTEEAFYRFAMDLDQKIAEARAAHKDPRTLLTPGTPDYVLAPERVQTFLASPRQALRDAAAKAGAPATAAPVRVANDADFNALPKGALYIGPDGVTRRKP